MNGWYTLQDLQKVGLPLLHSHGGITGQEEEVKTEKVKAREDTSGEETEEYKGNLHKTILTAYNFLEFPTFLFPWCITK